MKNFKNISGLIAVIMVAGLITPSLGSAQIAPRIKQQINPTATSATKTSIVKDAFCSRFLETIGEVDQKVKERGSKLETKRTERKDVLTNRKNERDVKLDENRVKEMLILVSILPSLNLKLKMIRKNKR